MPFVRGAQTDLAKSRFGALKSKQYDLPLGLPGATVQVSMNAAMQRAEELKIEQMMRELQSELCAAVEAGDMTDEQANEWANMKADQWARGLS